MKRWAFPIRALGAGWHRTKKRCGDRGWASGGRDRGISPGGEREVPLGLGGIRAWALLKPVCHLLAHWLLVAVLSRPHLLVTALHPGLALLLGKGLFLAVLVPFLPFPPRLPGSSGYQLSPDLAFRLLFLVQANSFHLRQVTFGGSPPWGICLSGVTDGVALSVGSAMKCQPPCSISVDPLPSEPGVLCHRGLEVGCKSREGGMTLPGCS